ncbi:MAG: ABC transporter substrate-binding protein [Chloroflexi bacterium]|nr:ABC transporter substrate-binding protein [Chloroflexota bacterium]
MSVTQGALFVAVDQGIFNRNGLDVAIQQINPPAQIPALLAGELDFAGVGANEVANADLAGASIVMVATAVDVPFFSLYADKKYKTVQDLAGQSIGVTSAGASTDVAAQLFMQHFGLTGKVKILPTGGTQPAILAAMTNGAIAGGILAPPTTELAAKSGFVELINGITLGVPLNTNGIAITRQYATSHPDTVKRFLTAYQQAWTYNADPANQAVVVKTLAKYTKSSEADTMSGYQAMLKVWQGSKTPAINPQALGNALQLSSDPKAKQADPNQFIDNSFVNSLG